MSLTLTALIATCSLPQSPPHSLELVAVRVESGRRDCELPPFGTLMPSPEQSTRMRCDLLGGGDGDRFADESPQSYLDLRYTAGPQAERLAWTSDGGVLWLTGEHELVARARAELTALAALVDRPIEVTATLYAGTDAIAPPVVLGTESAADAGRGDRLWTATATTRSGGTAAFDAMRWVRYVRSANVEVAQKSSISNPTIAAFGEGIAAAVSVHALVDSDDLVVFVQFAFGQRRRIETVTTGVPGQPALDVPTLDTAFATAAARLPKGGSMQLVLGGHADAGPRLVFAVQPRCLAPVPPQPEPGTAWLPISGLVAASLRLTTELPDDTPAVEDEVREPLRASVQGPSLDRDRLTEIVRRAVGDEAAAIGCCGPHLFVRGTATAQATAAATIVRLQDRLLRNVAVRADTELTAGAGATPFPATKTGEPAVCLHRVALPTLPDCTAIAFRGMETTAIRTMWSEIAQEASVLAPVVETRRPGLTLVAAAATGDRVEVTLRSNHELPAFVRSLPGGGALHLGTTDTVTAHAAALAPTSGPIELGTGTAVEFLGRSWVPVLHAAHEAAAQSR